MTNSDGTQSSKKRVLLVDDDLFIRELYHEVLEQAGYDVDTAPDGEVGLQKILTGGYNLILLDIMMPKLDGVGVLDALQTQQPAQKNGPVALLTNLAHDPIVREALKKGAKDCLIKADLNPDEFLARVKALAR